MTTILGLDPSLRCIGYAILHVEDDAPLDWGVYKPEQTSIDCILADARDWLWHYLDPTPPDAVAIEMPVLYRNTNTTIKLAQMVGVLREAAFDWIDTIIEIIPSQRHQAFGLPVRMKRKDAKCQIRRLVNLRYGLALKASEHDISDAIAVALAGWNKWRLEGSCF